jgi:hypothetical protein
VLLSLYGCRIWWSESIHHTFCKNVIDEKAHFVFFLGLTAADLCPDFDSGIFRKSGARAVQGGFCGVTDVHNNFLEASGDMVGGDKAAGRSRQRLCRKRSAYSGLCGLRATPVPFI